MEYAQMNAQSITRMIELQSKADNGTVTTAEGIELVGLIGQMQSFTQGARTSAGNAGIVMATEDNQRTMKGIADKLSYNIEGILRYHYDGVLGNVLARYNTLAADSKGTLPRYDSVLDLYANLSKLPAIYQASINSGLEAGRERMNKSWSKELGLLNKSMGTPVNTPVSLVTEKIKK